MMYKFKKNDRDSDPKELQGFEMTPDAQIQGDHTPAKSPALAHQMGALILACACFSCHLLPDK